MHFRINQKCDKIMFIFIVICLLQLTHLEIHFYYLLYKKNINLD